MVDLINLKGDNYEERIGGVSCSFSSVGIKRIIANVIADKTKIIRELIAE